MQTVAETSVFQRRATALLSEDEHNQLITFLAKHPEAGDEIVGTGGVRKLRFATGTKGKSGGVRVIYYFYSETLPLYALLIYGKNEKANLTADEKKAVAKLASLIKATARKQEI